MAETAQRAIRKERIGVVLSNKMQKTLVVQVRRRTQHASLGKVIEKAIRFKVHDEKNEAKVGDRVRIVETRPLSKDKRWRLVEILERSQAQDPALELKDELQAEKNVEKQVVGDERKKVAG